MKKRPAAPPQNVTVPKAEPAGAPPPAPVVAVETRLWWQDPAFLISCLTALAGAADVANSILVEVVRQVGPQENPSFLSIVMAVLGAWGAYERKRKNTVVR